MKKTIFLLLYSGVNIYILIRIMSTLFPATPPSPEKPNIILFSIDTLRADHLSCYGYSRETSPNIDKFSRESILFKKAVSQSHFTTPSHMSIFTALTPFGHQIDNPLPRGSHRRVSDSIVMLAEILKKNGYTTIGLHGSGNVGEWFGFDRGFDHYSPDFYEWEKDYTASREGLAPIKDSIRGWIETSRKEKKPLFLFLHHYLCHVPYLKGPPEFRQHFLTEKVETLPTTPRRFIAQ